MVREVAAARRGQALEEGPKRQAVAGVDSRYRARRPRARRGAAELLGEPEGLPRPVGRRITDHDDPALGIAAPGHRKRGLQGLVDGLRVVTAALGAQAV